MRAGHEVSAGITRSSLWAASSASYRLASRSFAALRAFLHGSCGKQSCEALCITKGPKSCEKFELYRRQCCRVPLPEIADALQALAASDAATAAVRSSQPM